MFFKDKALALKLAQIEKENLELQNQLKKLKEQIPQIVELSKLLVDLQNVGSGLLHLRRIRSEEVYLWRHDE